VNDVDECLSIDQPTDSEYIGEAEFELSELIEHNMQRKAYALVNRTKKKDKKKISEDVSHLSKQELVAKCQSGAIILRANDPELSQSYNYKFKI
jgi:hypothetical protein